VVEVVEMVHLLEKLYLSGGEHAHALNDLELLPSLDLHLLALERDFCQVQSLLRVRELLLCLRPQSR
jgi:hypothetical protein